MAELVFLTAKGPDWLWDVPCVLCNINPKLFCCGLMYEAVIILSLSR